MSNENNANVRMWPHWNVLSSQRSPGFQGKLLTTLPHEYFRNILAYIRARFHVGYHWDSVLLEGVKG